MAVNFSKSSVCSVIIGFFEGLLVLLPIYYRAAIYSASRCALPPGVITGTAVGALIAYDSKAFLSFRN